MGYVWGKVRFYPEVWHRETVGMSREERDYCLDMCVQYWLKRQPTTLEDAELDESSEILQALINRGAVIEKRGGWIPKVVFRMSLHMRSLRQNHYEWERTRTRIFERDDYTCQYCDTKEGPFECDHIHPVSLGGSNDDENLNTACTPCNRAKGAKTLEEFINVHEVTA